MALTTYIRQEHFFRRDSLIAAEAIDIDTYSRVGRYGINAKAFTTNTAENPQFLFMETVSSGETVSVAHFGQGQVKLALSGAGIKGQKLTTGSNGLIVAGSEDSADIGANDFGIALEDWADGNIIECEILEIT